MAESRGGLQYQIVVRDQFSEATGQFIASIRAAKDEFASFRAEVSKGTSAASGLRAAAKEAQAASRSRRKDLSEEDKALQELAATAKKQRDLERESVRIRSTQTRDATRAAQARAKAEREASKARTQGARAEEDASKKALASERARLRALAGIASEQKRREREAQRINVQGRRDVEANAQAQLEAVKRAADVRERIEKQRLQLAKAAAAERTRLEKTNPKAQGTARAEDIVRQRATAQETLSGLRRLGREDLITKQLRRQAGELKASDSAANRLLFTFRRLVGVLAAFQLARAVVTGFKNLILDGVSFNDEIRKAEIGVAGLVVALADVRNEQGDSVTLAEEFARAQGEARRQVEILRQDALLTTATFDQLLDTFQIAIAPGFAAGFNLDEVRKLSVSISQAATAIGLPQNQLAEEIRSLLSGTIQARTTRIATALQITNADIRRLKATGELFNFLEERFKALGDAAEQAARQTLDGIGNLVKDATSAILGEAAEPLFKELIRLGNGVFDQVLTIRDASGDIKPNPEAVKAFRTLFDALKDGVAQARELGQSLGFVGLKNILGAIGGTINAVLQFAIGALDPILGTVNQILQIVRDIGGVIGLDVNQGLGNTSRLLGTIVASLYLVKTSAAFAGIKFKDFLNPIKARAFGVALRENLASPLGQGGVILAGLGLVARGFEFILEKIFGVNLSLKETIVLVSLAFTDTLDAGVTAFDKGIVKLAGGIKKLFVDSAGDKEVEDRVNALLAGLDEQRAKVAADALKSISDVVNAARVAAGELPAPGDRGADDANAAGVKRFGENVSNVESIVAKAAGLFGEIEDDLRRLGAEFDAAGKKTGASGFAGEVENAMADAAVAVALQAREIKSALDQIDREFKEGAKNLGIAPDRLEALKTAAGAADPKARQRKLKELDVSASEGRLVSFLRDEARLRETLKDLELQQFQAAQLRLAIVAREQLPAVKREVDSLRVQAEGEAKLTAAIVGRAGARRIASIESENELAKFRQESQERLRLLAQEAQAAHQQAAPLTGFDTDEEIAQEKARSGAAAALAVELDKQLGLETLIAAAKEKQLAFAAEQARLAAEGTFTAGLRAGFKQLAEELPTLFDAAKNIVNSIVQSFVSTAGGLFRDLFDPRTQADLGTAFGEFLLNAGQQIFEQTISTLIQSLISSLVTTTGVEITAATSAATIKVGAANAAAAIEISAATTAAAIRASASVAGGAVRGGLVPAGGFASGGLIPNGRRHAGIAHAHAKGFAKGGRPRGLDPRDTVPAWLQPGEFVVRKSVVDSMGVGFFKAVNAGSFSAPGGPPSGEGAAVGMANGGRVTKQEPARIGSRKDDGPKIIPAIVTSPREMDRLSAGGKNANLEFIRENAGTIRAYLGM